MCEKSSDSKKNNSELSKNHVEMSFFNTSLYYLLVKKFTEKNQSHLFKETPTQDFSTFFFNIVIRLAHSLHYPATKKWLATI